ncbi:MAG: hypothetical protein ABI461_12610 [Polyangiaceae bacterium]
MLSIRIGVFMAVFSPVVACSSASQAPLDPASSTSSSDDRDGGRSGRSGNDGGAHGSDGGSTASAQGTATFNIDGKNYVATNVTAKRTAKSIEIDATMNDGQYDQTMTLTFKPADAGSSTCGSILGDSDRAVVYSETFDDGGQTATEQQFMSGLGSGDPSEACTFDIDTASPASGSASGTLDDSNSLIGGDTPVKDPVSFTVTWSGVP